MLNYLFIYLLVKIQTRVLTVIWFCVSFLVGVYLMLRVALHQNYTGSERWAIMEPFGQYKSNKEPIFSQFLTHMDPHLKVECVSAALP